MHTLKLDPKSQFFVSFDKWKIYQIVVDIWFTVITLVPNCHRNILVQTFIKVEKKLRNENISYAHFFFSPWGQIKLWHLAVIENSW